MIVLKLNEPVPTHKDYYDECLARAFFRASYVGGYKYKNALDCDGEPVFIEHENESAKSCKRRKRCTIYDNYCAIVIDRFNNFIFSNSIRRDQSESFSEWSKDVDMGGTSYEDFMKETAKEAAVDGKIFIQIESTKTEDEVDQTILQAEAVGNRLFLIRIDADRVVNWTCVNGVYTEILVEYPDEDKFCFYTPTYYQEGYIDPDNENKIVSLGDIVPHDFGRLPIFCCSAFVHGMSQLRDIAEANKLLFNLSSLHIEELTKHTFTQSFISNWKPKNSENKNNYDTISFGSVKYIVLKTDTDQTLPITVDKTGADVSQAESLKSAIKGVIESIYRQAGLSDLSHDSMGQRSSGNSLKIKLNDMTLMAASISINTEKADNTVIDFLNAFNNGLIYEHSVYPTGEELDIEAFGDELDATLKIISNKYMPKTLKNEQLRSFSKMIFPRMDASAKLEFEQDLLNLVEATEEAAEEGETNNDQLDSDVDPVNQI